jgi:hypothetical protein
LTRACHDAPGENALRITMIDLLAGFAAPELAADQLPVFRPGPWECKRSVDSGDGRPAKLTSQQCTSPTDDMNSFSLKCTIQGVPIASKQGGKTTREQLTARRLGDCQIGSGGA